VLSRSTIQPVFLTDFTTASPSEACIVLYVYLLSRAYLVFLTSGCNPKLPSKCPVATIGTSFPSVKHNAFPIQIFGQSVKFGHFGRPNLGKHESLCSAMAMVAAFVLVVRSHVNAHFQVAFSIQPQSSVF